MEKRKWASQQKLTIVLEGLSGLASFLSCLFLDFPARYPLNKFFPL